MRTGGKLPLPANLREQQREETEGDAKKGAAGEKKKTWSKNSVLFHGLITFVVKSKNQHLRAQLWPLWGTPHSCTAEMLIYPSQSKSWYSWSYFNRVFKFMICIQIQKKFWNKMARKNTKKQPPSCGELSSSISMPSFWICSRLREPECFTFQCFCSSFHT